MQVISHYKGGRRKLTLLVALSALKLLTRSKNLKDPKLKSSLVGGYSLASAICNKIVESLGRDKSLRVGK